MRVIGRGKGTDYAAGGRAQRRPAALAAIVTVVVCATLASTSARAGDSYTPARIASPECDLNLTPNPAPGCENWRNPDAEFQRYLSGTLNPQLDRVFGPQGSRLTWWEGLGSEGILHVGLVDPSPTDLETFYELTQGHPRIEAVPVAKSWDDLTALKDDALARAIKVAGHHEPQVIWGGVEPSIQKVVLEFRFLDPSELAEIRRYLSPDVVEIRVYRGLTYGESHSSRTEYPPYESGLNITVGDIG